MEDTIVALSSGALPAGVAVVRVSGPAARRVAERLAGTLPEPRRASLRRIRDEAGAMLDRGLVLFFPGPNSATGDDLAEFHLHGGRATVARFVEAATSLPGLRLAEAGEFTRRAFVNGRIDLTEAEGLSDLLAAETERQRRAALLQAEGGSRRLFEDWGTRLLHARALIEASFDFSDEGDVGEGVDAGVRAEVAVLAAEIDAHLSGAARGEILREGFRVAIAGPPNAGKSSLLNALARREVAIVTPVPGTTRDVLEVTLDLAGLPVRLFDTAGLRETADPIEAIGVKRARETMERADLVLWLDAADSAETEAAAMLHVKQSGPGEPRPTLRVRSKADLAAAAPVGAYDLAISVRTGAGLDALLAALAARADAAAGAADALPLQARHRAALVETRRALADFARAPDLLPEVAAEILREAADRLGRLTGRTDVEDLLGVIFSRFCIGK
ncbi:tRNA uridine-5-carboxymethylaminomethyl(34) synthesis GTPase MnmE [Antarcticirhabdus aurantiaca]|uniref:tRNA uridine-5-carboxymethylaminomethyl(34) synthesis GTPase MnmE n=1 Tax=Antarcticirhabdus aurantiaca TaxID=2606717 RepID=A0ACD4NP18_9HYPH|nr:tRNA uridine-5-carboxymethylaminomethyl(34) synthesis GTPase MnmE [Antarcticirhabdus aurantiaca]WAJ28644.1 tRNA uridine-5-carboxymethylaminomethyl(34) synthesis GTPase MnmE [Jeongeuplla avenae]